MIAHEEYYNQQENKQEYVKMWFSEYALEHVTSFKIVAEE